MLTHRVKDIAAFLRAPLTSVFMVLEVSGNYSIILPVIVSNTIAYLVSRSLQSSPIFEVLTRQDGLVLPSMKEQREEESFRVEDAMRVYAGPVPDGEPVVAPLRELAEPLIDMSGPWPWLGLQSGFDALFPAGERRYWKSRALADLGSEAIKDLMGFAERRKAVQNTAA